MVVKSVLSCNCLNITIESETNEFKEVALDSLSLTEEEQRDSFFKHELCYVEKLLKINQEYSSLVQSRNVGKWIIYHCLNCNLYTHAVKKEHGSDFTLVTNKLLTGSSITNVRNSDCFSNVFNVVVSQEHQEPATYNLKVLPPDVEIALNNLKQKATESINNETLATEERIRNFVEEQNSILEAFKERVLIEQAILTRLIINTKTKQNAMESKSLDRMPTQSKYKKEHPRSSPNSAISPNTSNINVIATKKLKSSPHQSTVQQFSNPPIESNDSEGLFYLEGLDDSKNHTFAEHFDSSDNEDLIKEERYRSYSSSSLAKSLPISIPAFMTVNSSSKFTGDEKDDLHSSDINNPSDIAASIKALAKSVHGDAVFGDLPRPRVCNQF